MQQEREYFTSQFPKEDIGKFDIFGEQSEYSDFLNKRIKQFIYKASEFNEVASAIDVLKDSLKLLKFSGDKLFTDLQEKLLVVAHMKV